MAKKCVVSAAPSKILWFGGFLFQQLFIFVIDGGPESGGAAGGAAVR
jgi:hypothetical protein